MYDASHTKSLKKIKLKITVFFANNVINVKDAKVL